MGKSNKCSDLNLEDAGSVFFWGLIALLFILVIGNFILTLTIISFFKIGMGMESIKLIPELKAIKFYGTVDFNRVYKKDGLIESFRDEPTVIDSDRGSIKFNLTDRKSVSTTRFVIGQQGIDFTGVNSILIKDRETGEPIFSSSKLKYNIQKPMRNLKSTIVHAAEIISPIDQKLSVEGVNMFVRGIEGTVIDGKEVFTSAEQNIFLKSSNGSIIIHAVDESKGIYIDIDRIPIAPDVQYSQVRNELQYKLCVCYPKGVVYRVPLSKMHGVKDPCSHFDRRHFNPCL